MGTEKYALDNSETLKKDALFFSYCNFTLTLIQFLLGSHEIYTTIIRKVFKEDHCEEKDLIIDKTKIVKKNKHLVRKSILKVIIRIIKRY